jgi:hypothetical protein
LWRFGVLACLVQLSFARLEIAFAPYRFHDHNHLVLSIISCLLTLGVPMLADISNILANGHSCVFYANTVVKSLYGKGLTVKTGEMNTFMSISFTVIIFVINIIIGLQYLYKRKVNAVSPLQGPQVKEEKHHNRSKSLLMHELVTCVEKVN